jgi:hypothetical protein
MGFNKNVLRKKEISEIINSYGEIIGSNDIPSSGADLESQANNTTDYNAKVHAQPFRYDMLGRFGFTMLPFFESDDESGSNIKDENVEILTALAELMYDKFKDHLTYYFKHPHRLKSDYRVHSESTFESQPQQNRETDYEWAKKVIATIHPYLDDNKQSGSTSAGIDETLVQEKVLDSKNDDEFTKKSDSGEVRDGKIKKIAGLINKLDKKDVDELINLLERK